MTSYDTNHVCMESYSVNTDASGVTSIVLSNTPVSDACIAFYVKTKLRYVEFTSRTGTTVSIKIYKNMYDKTTAITVPLLNLPGGVTEATTNPITTNNPGEASNGWNNGQWTVRGHTHTVSEIFTHSHTSNFTATDMTKTYAASESAILITVLYIMA